MSTSSLGKLLDSLPKTRSSEDIEGQCRGVLRRLVEKALASNQARTEARVECDPLACPNCGKVCLSERSPYCSEFCKDRAGFVRQVRGGLASGTILDEERQVAFGEKLWRILGGGYPRRTARLTEKQVARVIAREAGICQLCGAAAVSVEQCGSG